MIIVFKWWLDNLQYSFHHGINHVILLGVADLTESKICFEMLALVVYYRRTLFGEYLLTWWNLFYAHHQVHISRVSVQKDDLAHVVRVSPSKTLT